MRFSMLPVIFAGLMVSATVVAATDEELAEYNAWALTFNQLGLHPTHKEIRRKAAALNLSDEQITEALKSQNTPEGKKADEIIQASGAVHAMYLTLANRASKSKSETTRQVGLEIKKLLDEVRREKDIRDVNGFAVTQAKLKEAADNIKPQIESEGL